MTSWECYEYKWFYMKYIGKLAETESLLSTCCIYIYISMYLKQTLQQNIEGNDKQRKLPFIQTSFWMIFGIIKQIHYTEIGIFERYKSWEKKKIASR